MKYYFDKLPNSIKKKKEYIDFNVKHSKSTDAFYFDPINKIDTFTDQKYMLESPNFFIPKKMLLSIYEKKRNLKEYHLQDIFTPYVKSSTDHQNRETFTDKLDIKKINIYQRLIPINIFK